MSLLQVPRVRLATLALLDLREVLGEQVLQELAEERVLLDIQDQLTSITVDREDQLVLLDGLAP